FGLAIGVAALALLWAFGERRSGRVRALFCLPSLALAGLVLLALVQAMPLPTWLLRPLAPGTAARRAGLIPHSGERVGGDEGAPVPLPAATLSQDPESTLHAAAGLAAAWIVLQSVLGLADGRGALRRFGFALTANAAALALFSLIQAATWTGKIY